MSFNVAAVKGRAQAALLKSPDEARGVYLEEIMDWTDNYTENFMANPESFESASAAESISKLWVEYATMEATLRQFKKAQSVFDQAIADPVAGKCLHTYEAYANYCKDRKKLSNAQKVYVRGVTATGLPVSTTDAIWKSFLSFMQQAGGGATLTIEQLVEEVRAVVAGDATSGSSPLIVPSPAYYTMAAAPAAAPPPPPPPPPPGRPPAQVQAVTAAGPSSGAMEAAESKSSMMDHDSASSSSSGPPAPPPPSTSSSNVSSSALSEAEIMKAVNLLEDLEDVNTLTPEVLFKRHFKRLPSLLTAPGNEPMLSGIRNFTPEERDCLEKFFNKRSTGGDGITLDNEDLLVKRIRSFRGTVSTASPAEAVSAAQSPVGSLEMMLDVMEALWLTQGLEERHFDNWVAEIVKVHRDEDEELRVKLKTNSIVKTYANDAAKQDALNLHQNRCAVQRDVVTATVNKTLYRLVLEQFTILHHLGLPYFTRETLSKIESVSSDAHLYNNDLFQLITQLRKVVCSLLSIRFRMNREDAAAAAGKAGGSMQHPLPVPLQQGGAPQELANAVAVAALSSMQNADGSLGSNADVAYGSGNDMMVMMARGSSDPAVGAAVGAGGVNLSGKKRRLSRRMDSGGGSLGGEGRQLSDDFGSSVGESPRDAADSSFDDGNSVAVSTNAQNVRPAAPPVTNESTVAPAAPAPAAAPPANMQKLQMLLAMHKNAKKTNA